ncbi:MAG TPA: hypothetical protein DD730_08055 [Desulfosporosinus sp.]|nr:hypothetical protein [Desulfosporosinus sp.]
MYLGEPPADERLKYKVKQVEEIAIYYPSRLKIRKDFPAIKIRLKKLWFFKWLELEGAMGTVFEQ